jgi:hypothetical protein
MIKKIFNKVNDFLSPNETGDKVEDIFNFINDKKLIFYNIKKYNQINYETFKYIRKTKEINIPGNFLKLDTNKKIYEEANNNYGNTALDVIISHEFGHQTHHQFLRKQESLGNWNIAKNGDICLTKFEFFNQKATLATDFFKANNNNPGGIERFMQQNFMESYADCYSGLVVYLKNDSKDIFDKIKSFRELGTKELKVNNELSINNGQILKGNFAITEYFNFHGIEKFRDNFINSFGKEDILNIAKKNFESIHHIIQVEALDGLYKTMKEEAKTNNLFLLELKDFCKTRHNCSINTFFDKFESHLTNLRQVYCEYEPINTLDNNTLFFDYDSDCSQLSQKDIVKKYKEQLDREDLIKFDNSNISKLKLNQFSENYAIQQSNYNSQQISINLENSNNLQQNIFTLREKFTEQKNKSLRI